MEAEGSLQYTQESPLVSNLSQTNPVHTFPLYFVKSNLILTSHLRLELPKGLLPTKILYAFLISPWGACYFLPPKSKYSLQHHILKHPQSVLFP